MTTFSVVETGEAPVPFLLSAPQMEELQCLIDIEGKMMISRKTKHAYGLQRTDQGHLLFDLINNPMTKIQSVPKVFSAQLQKPDPSFR